MATPNLVIIDTETTGLTQKDRILELSAITLDADSGQVIDEYDTLINPLRDIANSHFHGVTAEMVSTAPTFDEIHAHLANILHGSILVAHNINFDQRFLENEFSKVGVQPDFGKGLCTLRKTNQKLEVACKARGIELINAHRSLADARATAELVKYFLDELDTHSPVDFSGMVGESNPRTFRRDHLDSNLLMPTKRGKRTIHFPTSIENEVIYLDTLDHLFEDSILNPDELMELRNLADKLQISEWSRNFLNKQYVNSFIVAAKRDGVFTAMEENLVIHLVEKLEIENFEMPNFQPAKLNSETSDIRICFTGEVKYNGSHIPRENLESIASLAGMTCVSSVTKKSCTLVVAADVHTMSGKAKKARDFQIPVISIEDFFALEDVASISNQILKQPDWF